MIQKVIMIVLTIFFARYFTVTQYGLYSQIFLVVGFTVAFVSSALPMGLSYFYGQYGKYRQRQVLFKRFFYTFSLMSILIGLFFILNVEYISKIFSNQWFLNYKYIIALLIIFSILNGFYRNFSLLTNNLKKFLLVNTLVLVLMFVLQIVNILTILNIFYLLIVFVIAQISIFLILSMDMRKYLAIKSKQKFINIKEAKYILPISAVGLIGIINELIDQFMVSVMLNPISMAELKVGSFQIPFISVITVSVVTVLIPVFSKLITSNNKQSIILQWKEATEKTTVLLLPIFIFCLVFAHEIIGLLFSDKYNNAPLVFQIYTLKYFLTVITFGAVMGSIGLQKEWMINLIIVVIINIVLNYFAIQYYGIFGAATVTALVWYIGASLQIYQINKKLECGFFDYFPHKRYIKVLGVSSVYTFILFILFKYLHLEYIWVIPFAICYYLLSVYTFDNNFTYLRKGIV